MAEIEIIREMYFKKGMSISEIAEIEGKDRKTIRKYLQEDDWNIQIKKPVKKTSKIEPYAATIDSWLEADRKMRKKQRHTAKRVFDRLVELYGRDGFDCSYRTIAGYVATVKRRIYGGRGCYLPLEHRAGEAQVDFGKAEFIENGRRYEGAYLNLSFPQSNGGFMQLFKGENFECFGEGLKAIYEFIGRVPHRQWFDNAGTLVTKVLKYGERKLTDSFIRFKEHYGFEAVFCNLARGNEKGHVESKVGYHRRNFLVPIPEFEDIEAYNRHLLERCQQDMHRDHYRKEVPISRLFEQDLEACRPLPAVEFDVCRYDPVRTDAYGKFSLEKGRHSYSTVPQLASKTVTVCLRAHTVTILDQDLREVVRHGRLYGSKRQEVMDWIPYLRHLSRYPAALKYSGIYKMLPDPVQAWMENCSRGEKGKALGLLASLAEQSDFETAAEAFQRSIRYQAFDIDSVLALHTRMTAAFPEIQTISLSEAIPKLKTYRTDTQEYDSMLEGRRN